MCLFGYKLCLREVEHINHLFLHCSFVSKARSFVSYKLGTVNCLPLAGHAPSKYAIFVGLKLIAVIQVHILCLCVTLFDWPIFLCFVFFKFPVNWLTLIYVWHF